MLQTENQTDITWTPTSWKSKTIKQSPEYPSASELESVTGQLSTLPPLVTSWEIERLRTYMAEAAVGKRFILQGGDCAESFRNCNSATITNKLKILLQMSLVLIDGLKCPIVRIGRIAGQYAKPRSKFMENVNGREMMSYFGDLINGAEETDESRTPDPKRMLQAYQYSALTLNFIRALIDGGFTDLHHPEYWDLKFLHGKAGLLPEMRASYLRRVDSVANSIEVMEALSGRKIDKVTQVDFYTSHEGLSLHYESALTRQVPRRTGYYNLGCHLPWIGERTRGLDEAHVEFFRGIRNPIGVKVGPSATADDLIALANKLDPKCEPGRLMLIHRMGEGRVGDNLPRLIESMRNEGRTPVWMCDPMHGNTFSTKSGRKTRKVGSILNELIEAIDVHDQMGSTLGGVHFELTAENVTECIGGASGVTEDDLDNCYESLCDPRLNYEQAMELAFAIAQRMEKSHAGN